VRPRRADACGQASVELALVLPVVALLLLGLLQAGVVVRDQLLVVQAAREGAREASVTPATERIEAAARQAAPGLGGELPDRPGTRSGDGADRSSSRVDVRIRRGPRTGDLTTVTVSARPTRLPVVGRALGEHRIGASATMRIERTGP
jgi:Flp pilus assembly protein TadG